MVKITKEIELFDKLLSKMKEIYVLNNVINTLYWDLETYIPKKGIEQRSEEMALMSGIYHDKMVDSEIGLLLKEIKESDFYEKLTYEQKRTIYLINRAYEQQTRLPKELVVEFSKVTSLAIDIWKKAKAESNYELFKPHLKKIIELVKKQAYYLNPEKHPYDVMLDFNEPGLNKELISELFLELRDGLIPIIQKCVESKKQPDYSLIQRNCPIDIQKQMSEELAKIIKFDLDRGRIDETIHPFTTGYYDDVRATTHYFENNFSSNFFSIMHEGGHAIYEQNLPTEYKYHPIGFSCSMGMHEAIARFIENIIGRSREFWQYYFPHFKKLTGGIFADVEFESFLPAINRVIPSKIRVEADPVTYSLHIIIRFEIERDLFEGKISVDDLPNIWNQKYKEYLGLDIQNDAEGILQDSHWAGGSFGYFPDYALGNIYDGQLLWKLELELPKWRDYIKKGNTSEIINWLNENVHQKGNLYDPIDLMKKIIGEELTAKHFLDYIKKEYSQYYDL
ncbi:MAG: carboxypeptidase M32 [Asgard group archaeon]|nr:carboxypeptidase M32 [Asgard group archaeon]